ncbi:Sir2 family NAD-dependent protein deacetylase [Oleiphilus sp. HI0125]|uniref:Sir2 family NAD-dependent protein deacetylase n=1 Tax=Oleiphilus sp. HI0125 TaxID=1822266 RepID=UPI000A5DD1D4
MKYKSIVVLTGAGISAESGIQTFRASDGLWEEHRIEDVASPEGFARNPELVQSFYNQRRQFLLSPNIKPNLAHRALEVLNVRCSQQAIHFYS